MAGFTVHYVVLSGDCSVCTWLEVLGVSLMCSWLHVLVRMFILYIYCICTYIHMYVCTYVRST